MMEKEKYIPVEMEIVEFDSEDVIVTSSDVDGGEAPLGLDLD